MESELERITQALADRYAIEREIGRGGMATVYLADDLKHDRKVALKVLHPELAAVVGSERFLAEIRLTAKLQHPHILPLFDSGSADGFLYFVMPYVDGESLRATLDRERQLPVEEALRITRGVASALQYAHERGIIHRDIKPANVLLSRGEPLVADFGIALAVSAAGGTRLTETGLSLGSPFYMSPEQATAEREPGPSSDVYSLGCMLYEMLVGEPPFTGPSAQAVLGKILTAEVVPPSKHRRTVPQQVEAAVLRALEKLPADRFASAADFASALEDGAAIGGAPGRASPSPRRVGRTLARAIPWGVAAALGVVVTLLIQSRAQTGTGPHNVVRMALNLTPAEAVSVGVFNSASGAEMDVLSISPDGRRVAFVGRIPGDTTPRIFLRDLSEFDARPLPETERGVAPFFSPDGQWIGFYSQRDGRLKVVPAAGGAPQVICDCAPILSAHWGPDDRIVMDRADALGGLRVVPVRGGTPEELTSRDRHFEEREHGHGHPEVLPGGRAVLFTAWGAGGTLRRIAVVSLDTGERTTLVEDGWAPQYVPSGHIVYQRMNQLWAVRFDPGRLEVRGVPVPVVDSVFSWPFTTLFAVADAGTLVYAPGPVPEVQRTLSWMDRSGGIEGITTPGGRFSLGSLSGPRLSPDGRRILFWGSDPASLTGGQGAARIWVYEMGPGTLRPLPLLGTGDYWPLWTPDGQSVVFNSLGSQGRSDLYRMPSDGSSGRDVLFDGGLDKQAYSWLPGGDGLAYQQSGDPETGWDIWLLPLSGDRRPTPLVRGPASEAQPALSPDGRWLAYVSDESGGNEVYLRRHPELDQERRISVGGGMGPTWRGDGRELFYQAEHPDGGRAFLSVLFDDGPQRPREIGRSRGAVGVGTIYGRSYDVTPDGERLLLPMVDEPPPLWLPGLRIVLNWMEELEESTGN